MEWVSSLGLIFLFLFLIRYYISRKWTVLKKLGIPHTNPTYLNFGHMKTILLSKENILGVDGQMKKKFGHVWGFYAGVTPHIMIHDPDILREILIKQFSNFPVRRNQFQKVGGRYMNNSVNVVAGEQWKRIRSALSPSFSSAKLKLMMGIVESCTMKAIGKLKTAKDGVCNIKGIIGQISMDTICSAAFGVDLHMNNAGQEHEMITLSKKLLNMTFGSPKLLLIFIFQWLEKYSELLNISVFPSDMMSYYAQFVNSVISKRKENRELERTDLMQLMINAEVEDVSVLKGRGLSRDEIIGNAIFMLIAGHDTTSSTISFLLYNLACYPDVQEALYLHIKDLDESEGGLAFDAIIKMKCLDMCVKETLRLYAPTFRNARCGTRDVIIKGLKIPKNVIIDIPVYEIHHDPELWENPFEFVPSRFEDDSNIDPMHYQPFGAGPRHCIGMRFAIMEIKAVVCLLLKSFKFEPISSTPKPPLEPVFKVTIQPPDFELKVVERT